MLVKGNTYADSALIVNTAGVHMGDEIDHETIQQVIRRLYSLGLFSDVQVETNQTEAGWQLVLLVEEFPALEKLVVIGQDKLKQEEIDEIIGLEEGQIVSPAAIKQTSKKIKDLYESKGYLLTTVE
ncbi:hypothetical protein KAX22_00355, partial [bacterium]|nr:hypothetical protein [bacterium]